MYVRWKKRQMTRTDRHRGRYHLDTHALTAVLVESRRDAGRPRQRFVAHLATMWVWNNASEGMEIGTGGRASEAEITAFWVRVAQKLDAIEEPFDRDAVETRISANVPRPRA